MGDCDDDWVLVDSPSASQPPAPAPRPARATATKPRDLDLDLDADVVIVGRSPAAVGTPHSTEPAPASSSWRQRLAAALSLTAASSSSLFPAETTADHHHSHSHSHSRHNSAAATASSSSSSSLSQLSAPLQPQVQGTDVISNDDDADDELCVAREGFATPEYRAQWGAASAALAPAWRGVPVPRSAAECRGRVGILVRRGVPDGLRRRVWMAAAGVAEYCVRCPRAYEHAVAATFGPLGVPAAIGTYPLFGARALPVAATCLAPAGVHAAKAVLCMVATRHAELLCCPRLPAVVLLLLHFMGLRDAFLTVEAMLAHTAEWAALAGGTADGSSSSSSPRSTSSATTTSTSSSGSASASATALPYFETSPSDAVQVGLALADALAPVAGSRVARAADRLRVDVAGTLAPALLDTLFAGTLPLGLVVRVADCFLNEGRSVLLRVALALVVQYRAVLVAAPTADDFARRLEQAALQQPVLDAPLLKAAFRIRLPSSSSSSSSSSWASSSSSSAAAAAAAAAVAAESARCQQVYYRPKMAQPSTVLTGPLLLEALWALVPRPLAITDPVLVYEAERDGFNLRRLLEATRAAAPCLVLLRTSAGAVAGFYAAVPLGDALARPRGRAFGDGETFVFTLAPAVRKYAWAEDAPHSNTAFLVYDDLGTLHVGAGRTGAALSLTEDLQAESNPCDTFASPALFGDGSSSDSSDEVPSVPSTAATTTTATTGMSSSSSSPSLVVCASLEVFTFD